MVSSDNFYQKRLQIIIIIEIILLAPMQASVQTDRKKKTQVAPVGGKINEVPQIQEEDERQKERRIKKLTLINRQLIETLKRQNEELTKKINKQKLKVGKSMERVQSPAKNMEREKKQLANAYKQIEMYKNILKDMKAKQISTESVDKLNQLENKIRYEDATIEKLQKQLKYVKNIKQQQEKELHIYQNQDVKTSVTELEEELKQLKQKLKTAKKQAKKRQEVGLKQHAYFMELEKTLRKQNDEYYPGVVANKTKRESVGGAEAEQITEREWQIVRAQLLDLKKNHEQNNKKIEQLTRLRNKQLKSCEQNDARLKQKQRKLQTLKTKLGQLAKLVGSQFEQKSQVKKLDNIEQQEESPKFQVVMQNGKKVYKTKNPEDEREVKRWMIPQGYMQEAGKVMPDSVFFSDKAELKIAKKSKIIKVQVWVDSAGSPAAFQCHYQTQQNKRIIGLIPYPQGEFQDLDDRVIEYKQGDYLAKISGKFNQGFLISLTLHSKFGKKEIFNDGANGQQFRFQPRPNEIPTCVFGAATRDFKGSIKICYIGCQFIADW